MDGNYKINKLQLGKDKHSKVYIIKEKNTKKELIVKIYEEPRKLFYNNEKNILLQIFHDCSGLNNSFYVIFKDMNYNHNMFQLPKEVKGYNLEFLFYDYLSKLSLFDYINYINEYEKEIYTKFICYKLLNAITKFHSIYICHNKIDISNIMFDDDLNAKIIHFSEANIIKDIVKDKIQMNKDIFGIAKIIAKLISRGKFGSINYDKNKNIYLIYCNIKGKKTFIEESKFWKTLKGLFNIKISNQFLNFFNILIKKIHSKELCDINEFLNNEWINEINDNIKEIENDFKKDFDELYKTIIDNNKKENIINIDIKNILDEDKKIFLIILV